MKQIRSNIFETNSSSTHSFSVESLKWRPKVASVDWVNKTLEVDLGNPIAPSYDNDFHGINNISEKLILVLCNNPNVEDEKFFVTSDILEAPGNDEIIKGVEDRLGIKIKFVNKYSSNIAFNRFVELSGNEDQKDNLFEAYTISQLIDIICSDQYCFNTIDIHD